MVACSKWHEKLLDHAAGGEAADGLIEHVRTCADCEEALAGWRGSADRLDSTLDTLLRGKEPRAGFSRRLLATARSERSAPPRWVWAATAAASAALLFALLILPNLVGRGLDEPPWETAVEIASWRSPTDFLLAPPAEGTILDSPRFGEFYLELEPLTGSVGDDDERP